MTRYLATGLLLLAACAPASTETPATPEARNREALTRYLESSHADLSMMAENVIFTHMATGEEHAGREAVRAMLDFVYHQAFDGRAETANLLVDGDHAVLEGTFVGRHIGEFAGVPATDREVRVPLAVVYDFRDGQIVRGRVYFEVPAFLAQVGAGPPAAAP